MELIKEEFNLIVIPYSPQIYCNGNHEQWGNSADWKSMDTAKIYKENGRL
jgi:hypothetical protein